jgi:Sjoegren syndrome nuclear autoantigen 1
MAQYQNLVAELLSTLEELRDKREETKVEIYEEEEERHRIEKELEILTERLDRVNGTAFELQRNYNQDCDR